MEQYLGWLGLTMNMEKTHKLSMEEGVSVNFLGYQFQKVKNRKTGGRFIMVSPSPGS